MYTSFFYKKALKKQQKHQKYLQQLYEGNDCEVTETYCLLFKCNYIVLML